MMSVIGVSGSNHHSVDYPWCFIEEEHQNLIHSYIYFQFLVSYCLSIKLSKTANNYNSFHADGARADHNFMFVKSSDILNMHMNCDTCST